MKKEKKKLASFTHVLKNKTKHFENFNHLTISLQFHTVGHLYIFDFLFLCFCVGVCVFFYKLATIIPTKSIALSSIFTNIFKDKDKELRT